VFEYVGLLTYSFFEIHFRAVVMPGSIRTLKSKFNV